MNTTNTANTILIIILLYAIHFLQNVIDEKPGDDSSLKVVKYAQTPIMSTYLLAFVVGEYDYVEDKDQDGVLVRVYTPKGKAVQGQFALEVYIKSYY